MYCVYVHVTSVTNHDLNAPRRCSTGCVVVEVISLWFDVFTRICSVRCTFRQSEAFAFYVYALRFGQIRFITLQIIANVVLLYQRMKKKNREKNIKSIINSSKIKCRLLIYRSIIINLKDRLFTPMIHRCAMCIDRVRYDTLIQGNFNLQLFPTIFLAQQSIVDCVRPRKNHINITIIFFVVFLHLNSFIINWLIVKHRMPHDWLLKWYRRKEWDQCSDQITMWEKKDTESFIFTNVLLSTNQIYTLPSEIAQEHKTQNGFEKKQCSFFFRHSFSFLNP